MRASPVPLSFPDSISIAVDTPHRLGPLLWLSLGKRIDHLSAPFSICRANVTVPPETRTKFVTIVSIVRASPRADFVMSFFLFFLLDKFSCR